MIKKIHQLSKTIDLEDFEIESQRKLIELNSDYDYKLWTSDGDELKTLFLKKYPEFRDLWDKIKGIQRADLGRYLILYLEGGFYCDTDFYVNESLDSLGDIKETHFAPSTPDFPFMESGFTNYFIYSPPGNIFFIKAIDASMKAIRETKDYNQPSYVSSTTGKILLAKMIKDNNFEINIFFEKDIVNKYCECTNTEGSIAYHDGGTSRTNKKQSWVNSYVTDIMSTECDLRKNLKVKGNICQIPIIIIGIILILLIVCYCVYKYLIR